MPEILSELVAKITTDTTELKKGLSDTEHSITNWVKDNERQFKAVGLALTGFGASISAALGMATKSAAEEEAGIKRLGVALKAVGINYDDIKDSLESVITATQRKTGIADSAQRDTLNRLILVTKDYKKAIDLLPLAIDLAAASNMDASTAATYLGKAFLELEAGAEEVGIRMGQATVKFKNLAEVQSLVGGAAEAAVNPFAVMKAEISDMFEAVGYYLLPTLKELVNTIIPIIDKIKAWADEHPVLIKQLLILGAVVGGFATVLGPILIMLPMLVAGIAMLTGPIGITIAAIMGLIAVGTLVWQNWDTIKNKLKEIWDSISNTIIDWVYKIKNFLIATLNPWKWVKRKWLELKEGIKGVLNSIFGDSDVENWVKGLTGYIGNVDLSSAGESMFDTLKNGIESKLGEITTSVQSAMSNLFGASSLAARNIAYRTGTEAQKEAMIDEYIAQRTELMSQGKSVLEAAAEVLGHQVITTETGYQYMAPSLQHGGVVKDTGLALVHAGETVVPADRSFGGVTVNFTQPVFFDREDTMNKFVEMIRKGIQRQDRLRFGGAYSGG